METQQIRQIVAQELPIILQQNREVQQAILRITSDRFAGQAETESRFDRLLDELRRDREAQTRQWEEQNRKWEEQNRKWEENQAAIKQLADSIQALARKYDVGIGALGARWGLQSEQAFRNALKGILEESFPVQVINVVEFDDAGEVFGRPDQIELDLIIRDGLLIICEIKSSMSRGDVYLFDRKVEFYERRHNCKASRKLIISPMVDKRAQLVAHKLGIQVYSYAEDIDPAIFATQPHQQG